MPLPLTPGHRLRHVVDREARARHVAVRGLPHQPLQRGDADGAARRRHVDPHRVAEHQQQLPFLRRRRHELDDAPVAPLAVDAELRRLRLVVRRVGGQLDVDGEAVERGAIRVDLRQDRRGILGAQRRRGEQCKCKQKFFHQMCPSASTIFMRDAFSAGTIDEIVAVTMEMTAAVMRIDGDISMRSG